MLFNFNNAAIGLYILMPCVWRCYSDILTLMLGVAHTNPVHNYLSAGTSNWFHTEQSSSEQDTNQFLPGQLILSTKICVWRRLLLSILQLILQLSRELKWKIEIVEKYLFCLRFKLKFLQFRVLKYNDDLNSISIILSILRIIESQPIFIPRNIKFFKVSHIPVYNLKL